jgi:hypothetical protein
MPYVHLQITLLLLKVALNLTLGLNYPSIAFTAEPCEYIELLPHVFNFSATTVTHPLDISDEFVLSLDLCLKLLELNIIISLGLLAQTFIVSNSL